MRVVIDGRTIQDHFPGIGRYVYNLTRALAGLGADLDIVLLHDPTRQSSRFNVNDLENVRLAPAPFSPFSPLSQFAIPQLLRRLGVDLYHSTYYIMPYFTGRPTIVTLYDAIPFIYPEYLPSGPARWLFRAGTRLAARRASVILTISDAAKRDLQRFLAPNAPDFVVTPLAADERFRPVVDQAAVTDWARKRGLPARYALYLGINKPHKNLERLVRVWQRVCSRWQKEWGDLPALVLAGREDPRYPGARQAVAEAAMGDRIHFAGDIPDREMPLLYNGASLFVFPSLYEGFGLPVLEAMACGVPVACADRASLPEIVGSAAVTFDPEEEDDILHAILSMLSNPDMLKRRRELGIQRARHFSWTRTAELTLDAYLRALHESDRT